MVVLLIIFSQHLRNIEIPVPWGSRGGGRKLSRFPVFQVFPILFALITVWCVCAILTFLEYLPEGDPARVDVKEEL
ncbi:Solute carrier family 23 member 1, partial [Orchesella cincta]